MIAADGLDYFESDSANWRQPWLKTKCLVRCAGF